MRKIGTILIISLVVAVIWLAIDFKPREFEWQKSTAGCCVSLYKRDERIYESEKIYISKDTGHMNPFDSTDGKRYTNYTVIYQEPELNLDSLCEEIHACGSQGTAVFIDSVEFDLEKVVNYFNKHK